MVLPNALLSDPEAAAVELARYLKEGSLVLLIGAGASRGVGLPLWHELVKRCLVSVGLDKEAAATRRSTPAESLRSAMDKVERAVNDDSKYRSLIKEKLYEGIEFTGGVVSERLLIAFGALLMGSKRGRIRSIINFNFDDVLEWYLRLHGFQVQVVSKVPALIKDVDAVVYHPHGFLPKALPDSYASDFLTLSQYSYDEKLGAARDLWMDVARQALRERVGLFVGLSGKDPTFGPLLVDIKKTITVSGKLHRPTGFWLFGPEDIEIEDFEQRNIVPVRFGRFEEIPTFLLKVCQLAADIV
jgi:hypothetical protein